MTANNPTYYSVKGKDELIELPKKRRWDLQNGVQSFRRFTGTKTKIEAKFNELSSAGANAGVDNLDEDIEGQTGRLIARIFDDSGGAESANTEETNAIWELYGNEILKPIESHTDFDGINGDRKREIERAIREAEAITLVGAAEAALAGYLSHQVLDYMIGQYVLRKTTTVSSRSTITLSHTYNYRVITLDSINPPTALLGALSSLQKEDGSMGAWQWLKKPPQIIQIAKTLFKLQYEFWGAERWAEIYGGTWAPVYK